MATYCNRFARIMGLLSGGALFLQLPGAVSAEGGAGEEAASGTLEDGFRTPPTSARPRVWWHWMNGNVTKEGIRKDLEWMHRMGVGGVQNFDAALQTPQIVETRLVYMTREWKDAFRYAVALAHEKGLEFAIAASPGWSETGGPWVPPSDGMKKLVWSETATAGGMAIDLALPAPPTATGPFQDAPHVASFAATPTGKPDPQFYADVAVLAYPTATGAKALTPALSSAEGPLADAAAATDGSYATSTIVALAAVGPTALVADFGRQQRVRSISLSIGGSGAIFQSASVDAALERETAKGQWEKVQDLPLGGGAQTTFAFAPVEAQRFRLLMKPLPQRGLSGLGSVPGAVTDLFPTTAPTSVAIAELRFFDEDRIDRYEVKSGFGLAPDYYEIRTGASPAATGIDPAKVLDLTGTMRPDGTLEWTPPSGTWKIVRIGYSLTGTTNHPATAEATGLEADKYDAAAIRRYMDHYIGMMKDAVGPELVGNRGISAILTDSIEVGASNWTPGLIETFRVARGYDPRPWLPALTGSLVGTREQSDQFLFDFRQTLTELMSTQHYRQVAEIAHANGLKVYGEALEAGRPTLGNELTMRRYADIPMAALWTYDLARGPRNGLLGDMKGAASVAHIDGQNLVAAESLTAAFSPWAFAPADLKPIIDLEFAYGVNRPVIHTSVHQPSDDKLPGMSLGPFGQYFNRHESWAEMARPWVDYMSRSSYLLQQGRYFADVAYFYGEDAPLTVLYEDGPPKDAPVRYAFDFVSPQMLQDTLEVVGGDLVAESGARFRVLYLGGTSDHMTMPVLKRIVALAEAGATIVGHAPAASPSLSDDKATFDALVSRLWSGAPVTAVGQGRVIASDDVEAALGAIGIEPDFTTDGADILFLHRRLSDGDLYFLTNRADAAARTEGRFRVTGKAPELWHADTGLREPASYRIENGHTLVPLELQPHEAVFVVFREPSVDDARQVAKPEWRQFGALEGPWRVDFQPGRGAPAAITLAQLQSLTESEAPGVRYFSGTATYSREFALPRGITPGASLMLDLGKVGDVAEVLVNGASAGTVWKSPYRIDIGPLVRSGANRLEVKVANLWVNRLIGDAQPGAVKTTFTAVPTYKPDAPLRPSGLIGPVVLLGAGQ